MEKKTQEGISVLFCLCVTYNLTRIANSHFVFLHLPFHRRGTSVDTGPIILNIV